MKIELETRPCLVTFSSEKQVKGTFMGLFQHSYTHGDSPLVGGFKAGTVAYPIAIVEINGKLLVEGLKFVRSQSLFDN